MAFSEEKTMVAVQGIRGAYSQLAAEKMFPGGSVMYFRNFYAVTLAVKEGLCRYGVLPIENNTYGSVKVVYRILRDGDVSVVHALKLRVDHVLLGKPGMKLSDVKKIVSHEQALGQCGRFLHSLGDRVETAACLNTAVAARMVAASEEDGIAAISSPECASLYGLSVLKRKISDSEANYTRFLCVSAKPEIHDGQDRMSLILSVSHRPGSLASVLSRFADAGINLLKIESDPIPGKDFEFLFYIDIEATPGEAGTERVLREMEDACPSFRILGCYREEAF